MLTDFQPLHKAIATTPALRHPVGLLGWRAPDIPHSPTVMVSPFLMPLVAAGGKCNLMSAALRSLPMIRARSSHSAAPPCAHHPA